METKSCTKCLVSKSLDEFSRKGERYQTWCRSCQKSYKDNHYASTKKVYVDRMLARKRELAQWVDSLKEGKPCVDCGRCYPPYVMDYDHLGDKVISIAQAIKNGWSKKSIMVEIAKCELICSNCHRVRTHERFMARSSTG